MSASHTLCGECGSVLLICSRKSCGKPFPRRRHEDGLSWGARVYCGLECAAADRQVVRFAGRVLAQKPCAREGCEELAVQRPKESPNAFEQRKYCSQECGFIARRTSPTSKSDAKKAADREYQRRKREAVKAGLAAPRQRAKPTEVDEPVADPVVEPKPLIRPEVKVVQPEPAPEMWRPALWRALEKTK
jgi:hypothetical protein